MTSYTQSRSILHMVSQVMGGENVFTSSSLDEESHKNSTCSPVPSTLWPPPFSLPLRGGNRGVEVMRWVVLMLCNSIKTRLIWASANFHSKHLKVTGPVRVWYLAGGQTGLKSATSTRRPACHHSPIVTPKATRCWNLNVAERNKSLVLHLAQCQQVIGLLPKITTPLCNYQTSDQPQERMWVCLLLTGVNMTGTSPAGLLTCADLF